MKISRSHDALERLFLRAAILWLVSFFTMTFAQGTIQFGFEEFPEGSTPPFVSSGFRGGAQVSGALAGTPFQPFEGQKFLLGNGEIRLASPDGQPIQSFTLHAFSTGANLSRLQVGGPSQVPIAVSP